MEKTNVMRVLDSRGIAYKAHYYGDTGAVGGAEVASVLGEDPCRVYKTLVTVSSSKKHYVFIVPVISELDLKKAAKSVKEKKIEMIKSKELLPLTGYVHGGCSPIGMKKQFTTVADESAMGFDTVFVSAGKIGCQIEVSINDLAKIIPLSFADIAGE